MTRARKHISKRKLRYVVMRSTRMRWAVWDSLFNVWVSSFYTSKDIADTVLSAMAQEFLPDEQPE